MKNIRITHKGEDYIKVEYQDDRGINEAEITGEAMEIIEVLCKALHKPSPAECKICSDGTQNCYEHNKIA